MDIATSSPDLEAGFAALEIEPREFADNLEEILDAEEWADFKARRILVELPDDAERTTCIAAVRRMFPAITVRRAEKAVDAAIRDAVQRPIPQFIPDANGFIHTGCAMAVSEETIRLRRKAVNMYIEKRAIRPKHDPIPARPGDASTDERVITVEERRALMGLPSGLLRTVDYQPGQQHTPPTWLVKGLFPNSGMGMLVGESQSGKSFLAIHAAVCVARGLPFFGKNTKAGGVLYIAAEGGSGVLPRIQAADEAMGGLLPDNHLLRKSAGAMSRAPIKVMIETPNLSRDGDPAALTRTLRAIHHELTLAGHPLTFVVLDTYHAALCGGDEQSAADAGYALKPLKDAVEELGLFVLIVHHPGKDIERGARGSSALRAAVDTEIELRVPNFDGPKAKPAAVVRRATLTKQRDGAVGAELHYRLNIVELGRDEDGDPWETCTVVPCAAPEDQAAKLKGKGDLRFKLAMEAAVAEQGQARVEMKVVRGYFNNSGPTKETDGARRASWSRALKAGRESELIQTDALDQYIWFTSPNPAGEA